MIIIALPVIAVSLVLERLAAYKNATRTKNSAEYSMQVDCLLKPD
jgi:hypothetical protein